MNQQPEALRLADFYGDMPTCEEDIKAAAELRRLHEVNAELVGALRVVIRGVPDTWDGVKQAKAVLAKAQGEKND
jgi:hypothetical protein